MEINLELEPLTFDAYKSTSAKELAEQLAAYLLYTEQAEQFAKLARAEANKAAKALYGKNPELWDMFKTVHVMGGRSVLRFNCDCGYDADGVVIEEVTEL